MNGAARGVRIVFCEGGDAMPFLGAGWSLPEPRHIWSVGHESVLEIPAPRIERRALLSIEGWPFRHGAALTQQRIGVVANEVRIGNVVMTTQERVTCVLPRRAFIGHTKLTIRLQHPDARRPCDIPGAETGDARCLGVAYQALGIEELDGAVVRLSRQIRTLLRQPAAERHFVRAEEVPVEESFAEAAQFFGSWQNVGDDCEFGLVQRAVSAEPLGLFRFSSVHIADVTRGIMGGFGDIAAEDAFGIEEVAAAPGHDFMGRETNYGMLYHTFRFPGATDPVVLRVQEIRRLRFLARKLMGDVAGGETLFVVKRKQPLLPEEIARLLLILRAKGGCRLVWVMEGGEGILPGTAERLADDLIAAYVDRIDVPPLRTISVASWVEACRSAQVLLGAAPRR